METLISERGELFDKSRKLEDDIRRSLMDLFLIFN